MTVATQSLFVISSIGSIEKAICTSSFDTSIRTTVGVMGLTLLNSGDDTLGRELGKHSNDLESSHRSLYPPASCEASWTNVLDLDET
jgi:hypothetical protein